MIPSLPSGIDTYAQPPIFTQDLDHVVIGPPGTRPTVCEGEAVIILPEQVHYVSVDGIIRSQIDFTK